MQQYEPYVFCFRVIHKQHPCCETSSCICLNISFEDIRHFRNYKTLLRNDPIMPLFQQNKCKIVRNFQNIDKMVLQQFFLINIMELKYCVYLQYRKSSKWNVFGMFLRL